MSASDSDQLEDEFASDLQPSDSESDQSEDEFVSIMMSLMDTKDSYDADGKLRFRQIMPLACNRFNKIRHCAYCHKFLKSDEVKKCGKCHRRAYCGQECQALDWTSKKPTKDGGTMGSGQGHKHWCGVPLLEEDVEWDMCSRGPELLEGGKLMARTVIPPLARILVDGRHEDDPESRSRLLSHSCVANAFQTIDHVHKVRIIVSKTEIQPGEEICLNYLTLESEPIWIMPAQVSTSAPLNDGTYNTEARRILQTKWGVDCPSNCRCQKWSYDGYLTMWQTSFFEDAIDEKCMDAKSRNECLARQDNEMRHVKMSLQASIELPTGNPVSTAHLLEKAFQISSRSKSTIDKKGLGLDAIKEALEIWKAVLHPKSGVTKRVDAYVKDPTSVNGYLCIDKKWENQEESN